MSANNYIEIKEKIKNNNFKYEVFLADLESGDALSKVIEFGSLRGAVEQANRILRKEEVEYGISINLLSNDDIPTEALI